MTQTDDQTQPYEPPSIVDLGSLAELTQGASGNASDGLLTQNLS